MDLETNPMTNAVPLSVKFPNVKKRFWKKYDSRAASTLKGSVLLHFKEYLEFQKELVKSWYRESSYSMADFEPYFSELCGKGKIKEVIHASRVGIVCSHGNSKWDALKEDGTEVELKLIYSDKSGWSIRVNKTGDISPVLSFSRFEDGDLKEVWVGETPGRVYDEWQDRQDEVQGTKKSPGSISVSRSFLSLSKLFSRAI